jgi:ribonuclease HII
MNILQATLRAMEMAVSNLPGPKPRAVLVDGNQKPPGLDAEHVQAIVKGDSVCFSIAASSILAKVTRDRIMLEAHAQWPEYGFAAHKGYGTKAHMAAVRHLGPCPIHRLTFRPLPEIVAAASLAAGGVDDAENARLENVLHAEIETPVDKDAKR